MTGVIPRRPHARDRGRLLDSPHSSSKTIHPPPAAPAPSPPPGPLLPHLVPPRRPPPPGPLAAPHPRGDSRGGGPLPESLHRSHPDKLPPSSALGGQPATLRIPHAPCIPPQTPHVSRRTSRIKDLFILDKFRL